LLFDRNLESRLDTDFLARICAIRYFKMKISAMIFKQNSSGALQDNAPTGMPYLTWLSLCSFSGCRELKI
jgi:hypothetical protein